MKIGIIGLGFVGLSLASVLASKRYSVIGVDSDKIKLSKISSGKAPFHEPRLDETIKSGLKNGMQLTSDISQVVNSCKIIFISVGTPQLQDGSIDLAMIKSVTKSIGKALGKTSNQPIIIVKSTVIPQTTKNVVLSILEKESGKKIGKDFGLITNPEFLRETKAIEDTINPHVVVLGGNNDIFIKIVKDFYEKFCKNIPIIITNHETAEMIKYANNSFLATKISFINQIANICQSIPGANIEDVARTIGLDPRIGPLFLNAGPGYGGSCLPKDVKAIINFSNEIGVNPILLDAVDSTNDYQLKNVISTIKRALGKIRNKKITVLGLAFKADTDDVRDSVSIKLIRLLLKEGAKITVHDPKATQNTKGIFGNKISYKHSLVTAFEDSECVVIMTPWKEYSMITEKHLSRMRERIIIDSRRMLNSHKMNMRYYPIGVG